MQNIFGLEAGVRLRTGPWGSEAWDLLKDLVADSEIVAVITALSRTWFNTCILSSSVEMLPLSLSRYRVDFLGQ